MMRDLSLLCVVTLAATAARAVPEVIPVSLGYACQNYPGYQSDTGEAGPWPLYPDSTDEFIAPGAGSTSSDAQPSDSAWERIGIALRPDLAKQVVKCSQLSDTGNLAKLKGLVGNFFDPASGTVRWAPVTVGGASQNPFLLVQDVEHLRGRFVGPHLHFFPNGTQQAGVFIGHENHTTWAFKHELGPNGVEQYRLRLNLGAPLEEGEFEGFVRAGLA